MNSLCVNFILENLKKLIDKVDHLNISSHFLPFKICIKWNLVVLSEQKQLDLS